MILTRAPLRIPLGGGGTDFPNYYLNYGGFILGFALDKYVYCVMHDTIDKKIRLKYSKTEIADKPDQLENRIAAEALKAYGVTSGIEIATFSDVPEASGLGGSSSFCVALVGALRKKLGLALDKASIFSSAYDIERNKAGQAGGIQDQFFASYGGAWAMKLGKNVVQSEMNVRPLLPYLHLVYTNTGRANLDIATNQVSKVKAMDRTMIDNLDTVKSIGYGIQELIYKGEYKRFGETMHRHWTLKKARDPNVTNPTVDSMYSHALESGAVGGKLLGLGGGGYLLLYAECKLDGMQCLPVGVDTEGVKVIFESNGG